MLRLTLLQWPSMLTMPLPTFWCQQGMDSKFGGRGLPAKENCIPMVVLLLLVVNMVSRIIHFILHGMDINLVTIMFIKLYLPLHTVYGAGTQDARDGKELAINQVFFPENDKKFKALGGKLEKFTIKLNITESSVDPKSDSGCLKYAHGASYLTMFINKRPENGTCTIRVKKEDPEDAEKFIFGPEEAKTGMALLDEFHIVCSKWVDPDDHVVNKYIFKS